MKNIYQILKDKPLGVVLYNTMYGRCKLKNLKNDHITVVCIGPNKEITLTADGKLNYYGECVLFPNEVMRDWIPLTYNRGDLLTDGDTTCLFSHFVDNSYTKFVGLYSQDGKYRSDVIHTCNAMGKARFNKITNKDDIKNYIKIIEDKYNGKLNLKTLQMEDDVCPLENGEIYHAKLECNTKVTFIFARYGFRPNKEEKSIVDYASLFDNTFCYTGENILCSVRNIKFCRKATSEEIKQLFDALTKENKVWDKYTKTIKNLYLCLFEIKDWCLMKNHGQTWRLCQFGFMDGKDIESPMYCAIGGIYYDQCIPYNDQTKHLLGKTDEWKGE